MVMSNVQGQTYKETPMSQSPKFLHPTAPSTLQLLQAAPLLSTAGSTSSARVPLPLPLLISHTAQILSTFPGPTLGRGFLSVWSLLEYNHSEKYKFARSHQFVTSWLMELFIVGDKFCVRALIVLQQFHGTGLSLLWKVEIIPFQPVKRA